MPPLSPAHETQPACRAVAGGTAVGVKVSPGASRDRVAGVMADGTIKIQVRAAPEKGKANDAVVRLLASALGVSPKDVAVVRGLRSPRKELVVAGVTVEAARRALDI